MFDRSIKTPPDKYASVQPITARVRHNPLKIEKVRDYAIAITNMKLFAEIGNLGIG